LIITVNTARREENCLQVLRIPASSIQLNTKPGGPYASKDHFIFNRRCDLEHAPVCRNSKE
jgi:hypothetical protein